jgi:hypothetical protein
MKCFAISSATTYAAALIRISNNKECHIFQGEVDAGACRMYFIPIRALLVRAFHCQR